MIYLKTSIGIEIEGEDITLSSLQGNISGGVEEFPFQVRHGFCSLYHYIFIMLRLKTKKL